MILNIMDTNLYHLRASIKLTPVWHEQAPNIVVSFNNNILYTGGLYETTTFSIDSLFSTGTYKLIVEFNNKTDNDSQYGLDKAVIIEQIILNNITDPKFVWEGVYTPTYPKLWALQQEQQGITLQPQLKQHNYLGWNGKWVLTFDIPVFTWIHKTQSLGWIYD